MADRFFDEDADRAPTELESDAARVELADRVHSLLDALTSDPGRAELRRHRFQIGVWGVVVRGSGEAWIVLWEPHPDGDGDGDVVVVVQYVGPASCLTAPTKTALLSSSRLGRDSLVPARSVDRHAIRTSTVTG